MPVPFRKPKLPRLPPAEVWAREAATARRRRWEDLLAHQLATCGLPGPEREVVFAPPRRWRFDFAWPPSRVAAEVEGISGGAGGRHQRVAGFEADAEKYNQASLDGWRVFRFTPRQIKSGYAVRLLQEALQ
jgi:hypothetical protein